MRAVAQRNGTVEHAAGVGDHFLAALGVIGFAAGAAFAGTTVFGDHIGAIQRVIQTAPACVGGVECVTGIEYRHHKLRTRLNSQLGIHILGGDAAGFGGRYQVADVLQKGLVSRHVGDRSRMRGVPGVKLGLQALPLGQQCSVLRRQIRDDGVKARPEGAWLDAGSGEYFLLNKLVEGGCNIQTVDARAGFRHGNFPTKQKKRGTPDRPGMPSRRKTAYFSPWSVPDYHAVSNYIALTQCPRKATRIFL